MAASGPAPGGRNRKVGACTCMESTMRISGHDAALHAVTQEPAQTPRLQVDVLVDGAERQKQARALQEGHEQLKRKRAQAHGVAHAARGRRRRIGAQLLRRRHGAQVRQLLRHSNILCKSICVQARLHCKP